MRAEWVVGHSALLASIRSASTSDVVRSTVQGEVRWARSGPFGGSGGPRVEYFTDWWESVDGSQYFPTHHPDQVAVHCT
jgi:hypothetical protein